MDLLLSYGAKAYEESSDIGTNALLAAQMSGHTATIELLLNRIVDEKDEAKRARVPAILDEEARRVADEWDEWDRREQGGGIMNWNDESDESDNNDPA